MNNLFFYCIKKPTRCFLVLDVLSWLMMNLQRRLNINNNNNLIMCSRSVYGWIANQSNCIKNFDSICPQFFTATREVTTRQKCVIISRIKSVSLSHFLLCSFFLHLLLFLPFLSQLAPLQRWNTGTAILKVSYLFPVSLPCSSIFLQQSRLLCFSRTTTDGS